MVFSFLFLLLLNALFLLFISVLPLIFFCCFFLIIWWQTSLTLKIGVFSLHIDMHCHVFSFDLWVLNSVCIFLCAQVKFRQVPVCEFSSRPCIYSCYYSWCPMYKTWGCLSTHPDHTHTHALGAQWEVKSYFPGLVLIGCSIGFFQSNVISRN